MDTQTRHNEVPSRGHPKHATTRSPRMDTQTRHNEAPRVEHKHKASLCALTTGMPATWGHPLHCQHQPGSQNPTYPNTTSHRKITLVGHPIRPSVQTKTHLHHLISACEPSVPPTANKLVDASATSGHIEVNCLTLLIEPRQKTRCAKLYPPLQGARGPLNAQLQILPLCTQQAHSQLVCHQHETAPCLVGDTLAPSQWILGLGAARHRSPNANPR